MVQKYISSREKALHIKNLIHMPDVISTFHKSGTGRRTSCPIHGGEANNLSYNNTSFYCFVCGAKGDVIDFVMQLNSCSFGQAVDILDAAFSIGLNSLPDKKKHELNKLAEKRRIENELLAQRKAKQKSDYILLCKFRHWLLEQSSPEAAIQLEHCDRLLDGIDQRDACYDYDMKASIRCMYEKVRITYGS